MWVLLSDLSSSALVGRGRASSEPDFFVLGDMEMLPLNSEANFLSVEPWLTSKEMNYINVPNSRESEMYNEYHFAN